MNAYRYIRFSTPRQENGDSARRQSDDVGAFCARQGWTIVEDIQDLGQSAWTGAHLSTGSLGRFAARVRQGEIEMPAVLVVEKLDRLSRQEPRKTLRWMEDLCAEGLTVATVDGGRIFNDASLRADLMGTFEILMRAQLAHQESQQKSERVLSAIGAKIEQARAGGRKITSKAPGWLTLNADRMGFTIDPQRAAIVIDIYEMAAAGQGARWIAKVLNERGVPAWGAPKADGTPRTWEISSVRLILAQPSVEGDYVPGFSNTSDAKRTKFEGRISGYYPRIVDADLVARARAQVDGRKTGARRTGGTGGRHTAGVANLFAGLIRCGACGQRMHLRSNGEKLPKRYLQCHHAARSRGCGQREMFAYDPLEAAALDQILHLALDDRNFARVDETGPLAVALADVEKQIADRKERAQRLARVLAQVDDDPAVVEEMIENRKALKGLEGRREEVSKALDTARGAVSPEEHLGRVRELRSALKDPDAATRQVARLKVQTAMKGLGLRLICRLVEGERRETIVVLPSGFSCTVGHGGEVIAPVDLPAIMAKGLEGLGATEEASIIATRMVRHAEEYLKEVAPKFLAKPDEPIQDRVIDAKGVSEIETHLRRQRQRAAERLT